MFAFPNHVLSFRSFVEPIYVYFDLSLTVSSMQVCYPTNVFNLMTGTRSNTYCVFFFSPSGT